MWISTWISPNFQTFRAKIGGSLDFRTFYRNPRKLSDYATLIEMDWKFSRVRVNYLQSLRYNWKSRTRVRSIRAANFGSKPIGGFIHLFHNIMYLGSWLTILRVPRSSWFSIPAHFLFWLFFSTPFLSVTASQQKDTTKAEARLRHSQEKLEKWAEKARKNEERLLKAKR